MWNNDKFNHIPQNSVIFIHRQQVGLHLGEEGGRLGENVHLVVHEALLLAQDVTVLIPHMAGQPGVHQAEHNAQYQLLKGGRELLVLCENCPVLPHDDVPLLLEASNDDVSKVSVEVDSVHAWLVMKGEQVKNVGLLCLEVRIHV